MRSPDSSFVSPVHIGRAHILQRLAQLIDSARDGRGQVALISGEAGIGKSRMVAEAKARFASADEGLILQGRCFEPDHALPYAPLLDLLRQHLGRRDSEDLMLELGPTAPEIIKLLPELSARLPAVAPSVPLEPEAERRRLFETLAQWLAQLCGHDTKQPLLLIIEDLHWSDATSLEYLGYFARRVPSLPLLLCLTFRSDEIQPDLRHFLAGLDRARIGVELTLKSLSEPDVDALIQAILELGRPVYSGFLAPVYALTEGNPFFVEEILKSLVATSDTLTAYRRWDSGPLNELRIPRSVQDAVQRRAERLSDAAREVLTLAAVTGRRFDFALLLRLTELNEHNLLLCIKELMAAQLVVEESADQFAFRHALTRQAIYGDLLARERRAMHLKVADAMLALYSGSADAHLGDLAYHFQEAGQWEQALVWSQRAGENAQSLYTPTAAIEHFSRALDAANQLHITTPDALYRARGQAYEMLGEFDAARADFERSLQAGRLHGEAKTEWQALLDLGMLWAAKDYARSGDYFQQALGVARTLGDPAALGYSLNRVGNWHANTERLTDALMYHREALDIFEEVHDQRGLAQTLDLLGVSTLIKGDLVASVRYLRQADEVFHNLGDRQGMLGISSFLSATFAPLSAPTLVPGPLSLQETIRLAQESVSNARTIGFRAGEAFALISLGQNYWNCGDYTRAGETLQTALSLAESIGHQQWSASALVVIGMCLCDLLAFEDSQRALERALGLATNVGSLYFTNAAKAWLAYVHFAQGNAAAARATLADIPRDANSFQSTKQRDGWYVRAELALSEGEPQHAMEIIDQLIATAANTTPDTIISGLSIPRARALTALGLADKSLPLLTAALAQCETDGLRPWLWRIYAAQGDAFRALSRHTEAEATYAAARAAIADLALSVPEPPLAIAPTINLRANFVAKANAMLPAVRQLSSRQAAKQEFGGLTNREREVATLIAQGRSNPQIATELVLSDRTIEGHVGNILSKLGFVSRTQIAAWAVESGLTGRTRR